MASSGVHMQTCVTFNTHTVRSTSTHPYLKGCWNKTNMGVDLCVVVLSVSARLYANVFKMDMSEKCMCLQVQCVHFRCLGEMNNNRV